LSGPKKPGRSTAEETEIFITFNEKSDQESLIHQKIISKTRGTDSHPVVIQDGCIILRIKSTEESLFLFAGGYGITTYTGVSLFTKPKLTQMIKKIPSENAIGCCIKIQDDHGIHSARTPGKITCYNWNRSSKRPVDIYKNAIKRES